MRCSTLRALKVLSRVAASLISDDVRGMLKFKKTFLRGLRPDMQGHRNSWQRFVLIRVHARLGMAMYPRLLPGKGVAIDLRAVHVKSDNSEECLHIIDRVIGNHWIIRAGAVHCGDAIT